MSPTFEQLGIWMVCALFALDIWIKVKAAQTTDQPQKREVVFPTEFLRKSEVEVIRQRIDKVETGLEEFVKKESGNRREIYERMRNDSEKLTQKLEDTRVEIKGDLQNGLAGVHRRVDDILAAVSELRGEVKRMDHD